MGSELLRNAEGFSIVAEGLRDLVKAEGRGERLGEMAVLCRPMLSVKIHLWGTAITG